MDAPTRTFDPIRAESMLLEGFRRMDEWPALKKKLPWSDATFAALKELDTRGLPSIDGVAADDGEDEDGKPSGATSSSTGWPWAARTSSAWPTFPPGRVRGRKALNELIEWEYLKAVPPRAAPRRWPGHRGLPQGLAGTGALVRMALSGVLRRGVAPGRSVAPEPRFARAEASAPPRRGGAGDLARTRWSGWRARSSCTGPSTASIRPRCAPWWTGSCEEKDLRYPGRSPYYYRRTLKGLSCCRRLIRSECRPRGPTRYDWREPSARLELLDNDGARTLAGGRSENLKLIEQRFGVHIGQRGNVFLISGEPERVALAEKLLAGLNELIQRKYPLGLEDVEQASKVMLADARRGPKDIFLDTVYVTAAQPADHAQGHRAEGVHRRHPQARHRLRHRPGGHRQDLPGHGHGGGRAGGAAVKRIVSAAPGGRGRREARLPARRPGGEGRTRTCGRSTTPCTT